MALAQRMGGAVVGIVVAAALAAAAPPSTPPSSTLPPSTPAPPSPPSSVRTVAQTVVDVRLPPATVPALSPGFEPRALRGKRDRQPHTVRGGADAVDGLIPGITFVPLKEGGARGHWIVPGQVGRPPERVSVEVVVDTAADRTLVAPELARRLGLSLTASSPLTDASGTVVATSTAELPDLEVAGTVFRGLSVVVPERALRPSLFLLGRDALIHVDLLVDGVAGALAILPAGSPLETIGSIGDADVVALDVVDDAAGGRWQVTGTATGRAGLVPFILDVDTGAPVSSVPALVGIEGGLPADLERSVVLKGAAGVGVERRGRFALRPLALGMLTIGPVNVLETGSERGLLGTDVLARSRLLISPTRRALVFFPSTGLTGSRFDEAGHPLLVVEVLGDGKIVVDARQPGQRFLLRSHNPTTGAWRGGAIDVVIGPAGRHILETGFTFGPESWSIHVVPRTSAVCIDTCLSLLGDWPDRSP